MPYEVYRLIHFFGIFLLLVSLGGAVALSNGLLNVSSTSKKPALRKFLSAVQGTALLLILVAGFAMIGKHHIVWQNWLTAKIVIWLLLGLSPLLIYRKPQWTSVYFFALPLLAACAAFLALFKPI